jgi:predicted nucleotide-binding protein
MVQLGKAKNGYCSCFKFLMVMGKLGRDRVCCIYKGDVEIPSDIGGIAHFSYDRKVDECYRGLRREL